MFGLISNMMLPEAKQWAFLSLSLSILPVNLTHSNSFSFPLFCPRVCMPALSSVSVCVWNRRLKSETTQNPLFHRRPGCVIRRDATLTWNHLWCTDKIYVVHFRTEASSSYWHHNAAAELFFLRWKEIFLLQKEAGIRETLIQKSTFLFIYLFVFYPFDIF